MKDKAIIDIEEYERLKQLEAALLKKEFVCQARFGASNFEYYALTNGEFHEGLVSKNRQLKFKLKTLEKVRKLNLFQLIKWRYFT